MEEFQNNPVQQLPSSVRCYLGAGDYFLWKRSTSRMRYILVIPAVTCFCLRISAQEKETVSSPAEVQQLENQTAGNQSEPEDDSYRQQMEYFQRHPLNLNEA